MHIAGRLSKMPLLSEVGYIKDVHDAMLAKVGVADRNPAVERILRSIRYVTGETYIGIIARVCECIKRSKSAEQAQEQIARALGLPAKKAQRLYVEYANAVDIDIRAVIDQVREGYERLYGVDACGINSGLCEDFAHDVARLVPGAQATWVDELDPTLLGPHDAHCVVVFKGRYYDAEAPDGVEWLRDIPLVKRAKAESIVS